MTQPCFSARAAPPSEQSPTVLKPRSEVQAILDSARSAYIAGKFEEAAALYEQALAICRATGNKNGEGSALNNIGLVFNKLGHPQKAVEAWEQAALVFRVVGNMSQEASMLNAIGRIYQNIGQPEKAIEAYQRALPVVRSLRDKKGEANTLTTIGSLSLFIGQSQLALKSLQQALPLYQSTGDKKGEALALTDIGTAYNDLGQPQRAFEFYQQTLQIYRGEGDEKGEAAALHNIGNFYRNIGQPQRALECYQQALPVFMAFADKTYEANARRNIGIVYTEIGQPTKALEFFQQALTLRKETNNQNGEAAVLYNIGSVYANTNQPHTALEFFHRALLVFRATGDKYNEADTLNNIGSVHLNMGQPQEAQEAYRQALQIYQAIGDRNNQAYALTSMGIIYHNEGQAQQALAYCRKALAIHQATGDKSDASNDLNILGRIYQRIRKFRQARHSFQRALNLNHDYPPHRVDTLDYLASFERVLHRPAAALAHARQAVATLENMRAGLGGYSETKTALLASQLPIYYRCLELLLANGRTSEAFALAQKTKGRALLDLLASGRVSLDRALTEEEKQQLQSLRSEADTLNQQMMKESVQNEVGSKKRFKALQQQQREVEERLQTLTDTLYARHPGLADKQIARTATLSSLSPLLPSDTALLDYILLSDKKLVLFVVSTHNGDTKVKAIPIAVSLAHLQQECAAFRAACADPNKDYRSLAARLSRLLLSPALASVAGKRRLALCPDGPLWNVPFQALILSASRRDHQSSRRRLPSFLWQHFDLAYSYSATGVQAALRAHTRRANNRVGSLMVMANPDFGSSQRFSRLDDLPGQRPLLDPSRPLLEPSRPLLEPSRPLLEPSRVIAASLEARAGTIAALPGTQLEANALHRLFPDAVLFTDKAAQESVVKERMGTFRYLHFATHGFLNDAAPLLSCIVLAEPDKRDSKAYREDGFLTAREVFDLDLHAELVTLSACNTGRGNIRTGEGLVGLSWAFFVAGAPTLVVSQWSVNDAATAQLMSGFYANLHAGEGKSEALRRAALTLQREKARQHPYYWAPFILLGDWRG